jgi:hypothetical protein
MPYIINRAIHDADAHILETPEMLDQWLGHSRINSEFWA